MNRLCIRTTGIVIAVAIGIVGNVLAQGSASKASNAMFSTYMEGRSDVDPAEFWKILGESNIILKDANRIFGTEGSQRLRAVLLKTAIDEDDWQAQEVAEQLLQTMYGDKAEEDIRGVMMAILGVEQAFRFNIAPQKEMKMNCSKIIGGFACDGEKYEHCIAEAGEGGENFSCWNGSGENALIDPKVFEIMKEECVEKIMTDLKFDMTVASAMCDEYGMGGGSGGGGLSGAPSGGGEDVLSCMIKAAQSKSKKSQPVSGGGKGPEPNPLMPSNPDNPVHTDNRGMPLPRGGDVSGSESGISGLQDCMKAMVDMNKSGGAVGKEHATVGTKEKSAMKDYNALQEKVYNATMNAIKENRDKVAAKIKEIEGKGGDTEWVVGNLVQGQVAKEEKIIEGSKVVLDAVDAKGGGGKNKDAAIAAANAEAGEPLGDNPNFSKPTAASFDDYEGLSAQVKENLGMQFDPDGAGSRACQDAQNAYLSCMGQGDGDISECDLKEQMKGKTMNPRAMPMDVGVGINPCDTSGWGVDLSLLPGFGIADPSPEKRASDIVNKIISQPGDRAIQQPAAMMPLAPAFMKNSMSDDGVMRIGVPRK